MSDTDQRQQQDPQSPAPATRVLGELAADLRSLIETTRLRVARTVNAELVMLYWEIGSRIRPISLATPGRNTVIKLSLRCRDN